MVHCCFVTSNVIMTEVILVWLIKLKQVRPTYRKNIYIYIQSQL